MLNLLLLCLSLSKAIQLQWNVTSPVRALISRRGNMTHDVLAFGDTIHLVDFGADGPLVSFASVNATWNSVVDADQFNGLVYITNLDLSTGDFRLCQVQPLPFTLFS